MKEFAINIMHNGENKRMMVKGYEVDNNAFLHKAENGSWVVSDKRTGKVICTQNSKTEVLVQYGKIYDIYQKTLLTERYKNMPDVMSLEEDTAR